MYWLLIITLAVISGAWAVTSRLTLESRLDRLLTTGLTALAAHILILLVSGVLFAQLNRSMVMGLATVWLSASLLIAMRRKAVTARPSQRQQSASSQVLLGMVAMICLLSLLLIGIGCWALPPSAWDEIWYHLTPMAAWYQEGAIVQLPEAALWQGYDPAAVDPNQLAQDFSHAYTWSNVYPLNAELSALWTMVLAKSDLVSEAAQLPYVLLGSLTTMGLGRLMSLDRNRSLTIGLLFLLTPTVLIHLRVAYVDAAFASMVAASVYLLLRWQRQLNLSYAMAFGLAVGLMAGIKSTGIAFALVFLIAALAHGLWQVRHKRLSPRDLLYQAAVAGMATAAVGSFWYLRTWWYYGNPIYPVRISLLGLSWPGIASVNDLFMRHNTPPEYLGRNPIVNLLTSWLELGSESYNYYSRTRGLGLVWSALALPAMVPFAHAAWRGRRSEPLWMLALTMGLLIIQPAAWWPRYVLYIVPIGLVAMAWVHQKLPRWGQSVTTVLLVVNLLLTNPLVLIETLDRLPLALSLQHDQRTFGQLYYNDYAWVDRLAPSRIGHTPMAWIYPLYGGLRHRVTLVDGNTMATWRQAIIVSGVDYLVVNTRFGDHLGWANRLTDLLELYMKGDQLNVYRVER